MKTALFLLNAASGKAQLKKYAYQISESLTLGGFLVTIFPINAEKGLTSELLEKELELSKYNLVVCGGGDGSLNHVVNLLMKLDKRPQLGYIPSGSTNDFARSIGIPTSIEAICKAITGGRSFTYDLGRFNDRYFNYVAAFGAFSEISYSTDQNFKNAFGHAAYILNAISKLPENINYKCHMRIEADGITEEDDYIFGAICNSTSVGGFNVPESGAVEFDDGKFELFLIKAPVNVGDIAQMLPLGADNAYISFRQVKSVHIESDKPVGWSLDGENGGEWTDIDFSVVPRAIDIMTAKTKRAAKNKHIDIKG
ncbi:MAG: YegS/Rv2252/BmrU family lipid kinase [Lachnospiraceae bacterium]|nr:YegS/Rv2252/BmrU family lipid kinase [Lachnospiraceae bacterium]